MKRIVLIFLILSLGACSSSGIKDYEQLLTLHPKPYSSLMEAVKNSPKKKIQINETHKAFIRISDKAYIDQGVVNNFQVFEVNLLEKGDYIVSARSGCYECFGFRKKILYPNIIIFDSKFKNITNKIESESWFANIFVSTALDVNDRSKYYIAIAADNRKLSTVSEVEINPGYAGGLWLPFSYPVFGSPEGNVYFSVNPANSQ